MLLTPKKLASRSFPGYRIYWLGMALAIVIASAFYLRPRPTYQPRSAPLRPMTALLSGESTRSKGTTIPKFAHVVVIMEENRNYGELIGNKQAPYLNSLLPRSSLAENYFSIGHPSQPNYLELTSGTNGGVTTNCNPGKGTFCRTGVQNLADQIEKSGRSWKAYMESMPAACTQSDFKSYAVRHNPFVYYTDITSNLARCQAHDVPFAQLKHDLTTSKTLPDYVFVSPNLCDDMHDCPTKIGDAWLARVVPQILRSPAFKDQHSLLLITWDESRQAGDGRVPAILIGKDVRAGYVSKNRYTHLSFLHTIEASWALRPLTAATKDAPVMTDLFIAPRKKPASRSN